MKKNDLDALRARWSKQSKSKATAYIVNRALRTLRKAKTKNSN